MTAELLRIRSGANLTTVLYSGGAQALSDVISARVPILVDGLAGPITGPQLKLLAVTSPERVPSRPQLPTVAETVPGFAATGWFILAAPPGTPAEIVGKVREDLYAALEQADVRQKLDAMSVSRRRMTASELSGFIRSERELWKPVVETVSLAAK
jgi:tripartite-type tricarboxylate transporter receptor subunit TctC